MVHVETLLPGAVVSAVSDVVGKAPLPAPHKANRERRIFELRDVIQAGEYHVSAADLADALLASARRAA